MSALRREKSDTEHYWTSDLTREFGVTPRTLRYYEARGLLHPIRRGTHRRYPASQRARLAGGAALRCPLSFLPLDINLGGHRLEAAPAAFVFGFGALFPNCASGKRRCGPLHRLSSGPVSNGRAAALSRAQFWAISIIIEETTIPARKMLISVVASGKRCSST